MNPITYSLCQKPVIGVVMWITSLCSFPPLIQDAPISLATAGAKISVAFQVPVDKRYGFDLAFDFPSPEARSMDQIIGSRYDEHCHDPVTIESIPELKREGLGRPIPFRVVILRKSDRTVLIDKALTSLCSFAGSNNRKLRMIGGVDLARGKYIAEITNLESQAGLESVKTSISLVAGHGK